MHPSPNLSASTPDTCDEIRLNSRKSPFYSRLEGLKTATIPVMSSEVSISLSQCPFGHLASLTWVSDQDGADESPLLFCTRWSMIT